MLRIAITLVCLILGNQAEAMLGEKDPQSVVADEVAGWLAAGKVVAVLHGRDEWGPRALGGRSILADPRRGEMKDHLNAKIKFREEFRPFAPVVKQEAYADWFETLGMNESPYML